MGKDKSRRQRRHSKSGGRTNARGPNHPLGSPGRLPIEVWMEIIGEYSSKKERLALCKTSRYFHPITRICLYKRLDFENLIHDPSGPLALFEKSLWEQPELGTLIHDLSLRVYPKHKRWFSRRTLMSKIDQLPNLERLVIRDSIVTAELRDAICSRPRLKVLEFDGCILDDSLRAPCTHDYPQSSIVDLKILTHNFHPSVLAGMWVTFAPIGLQSLRLLARVLPDNNAILLGIMESPNVLEKLVVHSIPSCIIQFLVSSPRLRHLVINADFFGGGDFSILSSLPGNAIPLLEHCNCPAKISPIFVRDRPVHSVDLADMDSMDESTCATILDSMLSSLVPVTRLTFSLACILEKRWLSHIPITTRHLEFSINNKEDLKKPLPPELTRLPDLRSICIVPWEPHTRFSQEEILKVSETLPSLREIVIWWNETWRMTEPKLWEKLQHIVKLG